MKLIDIIPEKELKEVVLSEYERRIVLYKLTDERFKKKYGMNFTEFENKNLVKEKGFSWEVENMVHTLEDISKFTPMSEKTK